MATIYKFEDLEIWQLARKIYKNVSTITEGMRKTHDYRFAEQMKAAAGSIMDNIAEGFERNSRLAFLNSLTISKGECGELKSQSFRCLDDKYLDQKGFDEMYNDTDILTKKIAKFIIYLNKSKTKGLRFKDRNTND